MQLAGNDNSDLVFLYLALGFPSDGFCFWSLEFARSEVLFSQGIQVGLVFGVGQLVS